MIRKWLILLLCSEIPPLERQARGRRLQQQTHQTGWQSHHPGNLVSASCAQSTRGDIRVCYVFFEMHSRSYLDDICLISNSDNSQHHIFLHLRLNVNDIQDTCQKNGAAALAVGRRDLAKVCNISQVFGIIKTFLNVYARINTSEVTWHMAKYGDPYSEFVLCN